MQAEGNWGLSNDGVGQKSQVWGAVLPLPQSHPPSSGSHPFKHLLVVLCCVQLCLTLCDPMDQSQPGSSVCGISQARIVE